LVEQRHKFVHKLITKNGLILQAMKTGDVAQASTNLLFLAENDIIDLDITKLEQSLKKYQPGLPSATQNPLSRYSIPDKLAEADPSRAGSIKISPSSTTVSEG
jgi:hypothetical protein